MYFRETTFLTIHSIVRIDMFKLKLRILPISNNSGWV